MAGKGRPGPDCGIAVLLDRLDDDGAELVTTLLADEESWWSHDNPYGLTEQGAAAAFNELSERAALGLPKLAKPVVGAHRRGTCRCGSGE